MTECEGWRLLAGASGSTGETGASGQTGLTGEFRLWLFSLMHACMWSPESPAQSRGSMRLNVRDGDCLQGQAALQERPGPLGRRVSQVGSDSDIPLECILTWLMNSALH